MTTAIQGAVPLTGQVGTDSDGSFNRISADTDGNLRVRNLVWNTGTLAWQNATTTGTGSEVSVTNFPSTQAVNQTRASSATVSNVVSAASDTQLLASNSNRIAFSVFNDSDKAMYIKLGTGSSSSSFTVKLFATGFFVCPFPVYTGQVNATWESGPTGSARITEY